VKLENPNLTKACRSRRERLCAALGQGVVVLPTAPELSRNGDNHFEFRWDSDFYYFTGFREPEAVLVIVLGRKPREILFCRDRNEEREIWDGFRYGPALAREAFGLREARSISELEAFMPEILADQPAIHTLVGVDAKWDARVAGWLNQVRAKIRTGIAAPVAIHDVRAPAGELRLIKDAQELALMRRAAEISCAAHVRAMRIAAPGMREYQVDAEIQHEYHRHGATAAYGSIVGGGANACVLHYRSNRGVLRKGELLLIDAGCEWESYAADITRTFPIGAPFSAAQRDVYEVVLEAQEAAIAAVRPGAAFGSYHEVAMRTLVRGLIDLKLCKGSADAVVESGAYRQFYMHRAGHWLGLDVHDAGRYMLEGKYRKFQPGMVLTVEPGLYIRPAPNVPKAFWNIGVRIEDDVLVTARGCEVLTAACPKRLRDVEAAVGVR
jgi:Xaa-Pro aminopeptidase